MATRTSTQIEFGDFQTPSDLAHAACATLRRLDVAPASILEPTCGEGAFLHACVRAFPGAGVALGFELDPAYAHTADARCRALAEDEVQRHVRVERQDFFERDWPGTLDALPEPLLVAGNPPWVTSSALGALRGTNLPPKTNAQRFPGLDALTGRSNFDVSEWMLLHLLECLSGRRAVLAMLCKTAVARKVLARAWAGGLQVGAATTFAIDAPRHFGAAVDACLLVCRLEPGAASRECGVHASLDATTPSSTFALRGERLVADLAAHASFGHLAGRAPVRWRSGVKHDCARVMELRPRERGVHANGLGDVVDIEEEYLFPMLKSSEVVQPEPTPSRRMLVTQRTTGEDTQRIAREAPRTWAYLESHAERLDRRASSIYRKRPRFSVFGVGSYTFAPWKVATSGLYKRLVFRCVGPVDGKPVVLDDTCYFLPCATEADARALIALLDNPSARGFFDAFVFWDAKRPITAQLLGSLDLGRLAEEAGVSLPTWPNPTRARAEREAR